MRQASKRIPDSAEKTVRDIRRATRRHHSAEEKIRIVLEGLRGEDSIAELAARSLTANSRTSCARSPRELFRASLELFAPSFRSSSVRKNVCQLFQPCRICFNMTGIRF
jgi:transposase